MNQIIERSEIIVNITPLHEKRRYRGGYLYIGVQDIFLDPKIRELNAYKAKQVYMNNEEKKMVELAKFN